MNNYEYAAKVHRIVDGDTVYLKLSKTFTLPVDFGFNIIDTMNLTKDAVVGFRLYGINTPEVVGASKTAGLTATKELERLLNLGSLRVVSYKPDKYGRYLADIYVMTDTTELHVNQELVKGGFATQYFGVGPKV